MTALAGICLSSVVLGLGISCQKWTAEAKGDWCLDYMKPIGKAPSNALSEGKRLQDDGDLNGAARAFARLVEVYPEDLAVRFRYGEVLFRQKHFILAVTEFRRVLQAQPLNEWASLCLFHSLWKSGREKEALDEVGRFFHEGGESMEYRRLFKDIKKHL